MRKALFAYPVLVCLLWFFSPEVHQWAQAESSKLNDSVLDLPIKELKIKGVENPGGIALLGDYYYITDQRANRVVVINKNGFFVRTIGSAGSGKGELIHPTTVVAGQDRKLYIRDFGNSRVQVLDPGGMYVGELATGDFTGMTAASPGEILLGIPDNGALITGYDTSGRETRKIGRLRKLSEFYSRVTLADDKKNQMLINRVSLSAGQSGEVYAAFLFAPIVQKYNSRGILLWERRLGGPGIEQLTQLFLSDEGRIGRKFVRIAMDGRAANLVTAACSFDTATQRLYVLLPNRSLFVLDSSGRTINLINLRLSGDRKPSPIAIGSAFRGTIMLVDPFLQVIWRGAP